MAAQSYNLAMIGIGVMGKNLLLNMADHGFKVIGYNKNPEKTNALEQAATPGTTVKGVNSYQDMVNLLEKPRKVMLLVPAGKPVDEVIESLIPVLDKGDIVIDAGNSHYTDTLRRVKWLSDKGLHFMGMGVSGGEEGARRGPSIMPGGDPEAYPHVKPILEAVAAKVKGVPCVAHLGRDAAGHYVKMVHNGIEYAIMQMISECYDLLHNGAGLDNDELHHVFDTWNKGDMQSFLIEITKDIFMQVDDKTGKRLVDVILDKAGAKGTGKWTSQDAMEVGMPIPSIDMAVTMRNISSLKDERVQAAKLYPAKAPAIGTSREEFIKQVHDALYFGTIMAYVQGMALLHRASADLNMEIPMPEVVRVWRGGCIIRSVMLDIFAKAYQQNPGLPNLLLDSGIAQALKDKEKGLRAAIVAAVQNNIAAGGLMTSLAYFEAYRNERMPINLLQAQRDYFGAHTYQRIDEPGTFHTEWQRVEA
jgi:6-phosphogluconate dehydrogenase